MRIIRRMSRLAITVCACIYAFCLFNGISLVDYTATPEGGVLEIVGHSVNISTPAANAFWRIYSSAEQQAAEILPSHIKNTVEWISDRLPTK